MAEKRLDVGLHELPMDDYVLAKGPKGQTLHNQSFLKLYQGTASKAKQSLIGPSEPTPAMEVGSAFHCLGLEPDEYPLQYAVAPDLSRRNKAGKDAWAVFTAENSGKTIIRAQDDRMIRNMIEAVRNTTTGSALLGGPGVNEVTAVWVDHDSSLWCKARLDRYTVLAGESVIVDLKTCQSADPDDFSRSIAKFSYHIQAAFYLDAVAYATGETGVQRKFVFVAVEKTPPFDVAFYELDPWAIERGRAAYKICLRKAKESEQSGVWAGYDDAIKKIDLPPWAKDAAALIGDERDDLFW
jgi:hypothetical protein